MDKLKISSVEISYVVGYCKESKHGRSGSAVHRVNKVLATHCIIKFESLLLRFFETGIHAVNSAVLLHLLFL